MSTKLDGWRKMAYDIYGSPYMDGKIQCALLQACDKIEALEARVKELESDKALLILYARAEHVVPKKRAKK